MILRLRSDISFCLANSSCRSFSILSAATSRAIQSALLATNCACAFAILSALVSTTFCFTVASGQGVD